MVVIPYTTAQRRFTQTDKLREMIMSAKRRELGGNRDRGARSSRPPPRLRRALRHRDRSVDFWDTLKCCSGCCSRSTVMAVAGTLTLLVGAVGVMNIMLVVVT